MKIPPEGGTPNNTFSSKLSGPNNCTESVSGPVLSSQIFPVRSRIHPTITFADQDHLHTKFL